VKSEMTIYLYLSEMPFLHTGDVTDDMYPVAAKEPISRRRLRRLIGSLVAAVYQRIFNPLIKILHCLAYSDLC